jgi:hypothetical protein
LEAVEQLPETMARAPLTVGSCAAASQGTSS